MYTFVLWQKLIKNYLNFSMSCFKKSLVLNEETNELICEESGLAYPIRDGIPVMLPEEARKI